MGLILFGFDLGFDFCSPPVSSISREPLGVLSSLFEVERSGAEFRATALRVPRDGVLLTLGARLASFARTKEGRGCGGWQSPRFSIKGFNQMRLT
jgi:hypothetical protein